MSSPGGDGRPGAVGDAQEGFGPHGPLVDEAHDRLVGQLDGSPVDHGGRDGFELDPAHEHVAHGRLVQLGRALGSCFEQGGAAPLQQVSGAVDLGGRHRHTGRHLQGPADVAETARPAEAPPEVVGSGLGVGRSGRMRAPHRERVVGHLGHQVAGVRAVDELVGAALDDPLSDLGAERLVHQVERGDLQQDDAADPEHRRRCGDRVVHGVEEHLAGDQSVVRSVALRGSGRTGRWPLPSVPLARLDRSCGDRRRHPDPTSTDEGHLAGPTIAAAERTEERDQPVAPEGRSIVGCSNHGPSLVTPAADRNGRFVPLRAAGGATPGPSACGPG
nr:hypothetical protein [Aquihabitans sp. G128]